MRRLPAEWEPHERTWMAWPCRAEAWGADGLAAARRAYAEVAQAIARFEPVTMIAPPDLAAEAADACGAGIEILPIAIDDSWTRDTGPMFTLGPDGLSATAFRFNAWGAKYTPWDADARLAAEIAGRTGAALAESWLTAEGGAFSTDGEGTLLTTESCLLNPNRNPGRSREEITIELIRVLGIEKVIWLPGNPMETETDGHVDGIAVFAAPGRVLIETPVNDTQPDADIMRANATALRGQTDARGRPFELIPLPTVFEEIDGEPTWTCYTNHYIANGAVFAPRYGIPEDDTAHRALAAAYPGRRIIQLNVEAVEVGGGGIHCITCHQPAFP